MNCISEEKARLARSLILRGESVRYVASTVGIHPMTSWTLAKRVRAEVGAIQCRCGRPAGHKGWCGHRIAHSPSRIASLVHQWRDITTLNIYIPSRPRYERPDIPNERETEIPLLINRRGVQSLDAPIFEDECGHTLFKSEALTPLELLMIKEDMQSAEYQQRESRIRAWRRWEIRKQLGLHHDDF